MITEATWRAHFGADPAVVGRSIRIDDQMFAVVGVLPVSGITLPFLSAGGSSLVIAMLAAGMLANVARQAPTGRPVR